MTLKKLNERFPSSILETHSHRGDDTAVVKKEDIIDICTFLRDDEALLYNFMMDLTAVDFLGKEPRFEVVYHLYSMKHKHRLRLKSTPSENDLTMPSVVSVWKTANWHERECYDLLGIIFSNHPDLKRILTPEGFKGYPLRKDFPLRGR